MSQRNVGHIIERLLTDEDMRLRFAFDPLERISALQMQGFDLTSDEIDAFVRSDVRVWFCERQFAGRAH
jgi:hypothetical protein